MWENNFTLKAINGNTVKGIFLLQDIFAVSSFQIFFRSVASLFGDISENTYYIFKFYTLL